MDVSKLLSGIGVVIDDAYGNGREDPILEIVRTIEDEFDVPCYKTDSIPTESTCKNLLSSASFILLDWKLWQGNAPVLERDGIEANVAFLKKAREFFLPVFIFTNESLPDLIRAIEELAPSLYNEDDQAKNFIFIKQKMDLIQNGVFEVVGDWISKNASVYTLKSWERAFYDAKRTLFSSMYKRSPDWPKVFWKSYLSDGIDPSSSITQLINDSLLGRMKKSIFEDEILHCEGFSVSGEGIRSVISEASLIDKEYVPENEVRAGDLFQVSEEEYLINIRPDCDCIPRNNGENSDEDRKPDEIELYCIRGEVLALTKVKQKYMRKYGRFNENASENISFAIHKGVSVRFGFKELVIKKYKELNAQFVGRLIHPYVTYIQQRYALYLQRQGLPRIPKEAIET